MPRPPHGGSPAREELAPRSLHLATAIGPSAWEHLPLPPTWAEPGYPAERKRPETVVMWCHAYVEHRK